MVKHALVVIVKFSIITTFEQHPQLCSHSVSCVADSSSQVMWMIVDTD